MKASDMFPSAYLKAKDIPREGIMLTIKQIDRGAITDMKSQKQKVVYSLLFAEPGVKPLTLNKTNVNTLVAWYGEETNDWIGKPVTLIRVMSESFGKMAWTVRVEPPDEDEPEPDQPAGEPDEIPF